MQLHPPRGPERASRALTHGRVGDFRLRKVGVSRYDWRDPYYTAVTAPWGVFTAVASALVVLVNVLFAGLYLIRPNAIQNLRPGHFSDAFFFSVETMSTVGYGLMAPVSFYGHVVATVEIFFGVGMTATLTGVLFIRLSKPRPRFLFADVATVHEGADGAVLSMRVANGRQVMLVDAVATLSALMFSQDAHGHAVWQVHSLPLAQARISLFPLTWTLEHALSGASPLKGFGADELRGAKVKF